MFYKIVINNTILDTIENIEINRDYEPPALESGRRVYGAVEGFSQFRNR